MADTHPPQEAPRGDRGPASQAVHRIVVPPEVPMVALLGARDEVVARGENLLICKAAAAWTLASLDR